jgi:hypothetical protein
MLEFGDKELPLHGRWHAPRKGSLVYCLLARGSICLSKVPFPVCEGSCLLKVMGEVKAIGLIETTCLAIGEGSASPTAEEEVRARPAGRDLYDTPFVPLLDGACVQVEEAGSVDANAMFPVADNLPARIDVTEGIKKVHGHIAATEGCFPEGQTLLLPEVCQNALPDGKRKGVCLKNRRVVGIDATMFPCLNRFVHFQVRPEGIVPGLVTDASVNR